MSTLLIALVVKIARGSEVETYSLVEPRRDGNTSFQILLTGIRIELNYKSVSDEEDGQLK